MAEEAGELSIGANLAAEAEASLLRPESLFRDDMERVDRRWSRGFWRWRWGATAKHAGGGAVLLGRWIQRVRYCQ